MTFVSKYFPTILNISNFWDIAMRYALQQRNVSSLVSANLFWDYDDLVNEERNLEEECRYLKELLYSVAHVKNLGLDCWFIEVYTYSSLSKFIFSFCDFLFAIEFVSL